MATTMIVSLKAGTTNTMHGVYTSTGTPRADFNYIELQDSDSCSEVASIRTTTTGAVLGLDVYLTVAAPTSLALSI